MTADRRSGRRERGPATPPDRAAPRRGAAPADLLSEVLDLARREGALDGEGLDAFLEALRERARVVLSERFERLTDRGRALEKENAWRRESMTTLETRVGSLEAEVAWRRESMASLQAELLSRREAIAALEDEVRCLGARAGTLSIDRARAAAAHDALLAHHRELVDRVAAEVVSISSLSPLRARQARRRLRSLAERLRADTR